MKIVHKNIKVTLNLVENILGWVDISDITQNMYQVIIILLKICFTCIWRQ